MGSSAYNNLYSFNRSSGGEYENILVIANPGAGKTEEIANFAVKLVSEKVPPENILCITFTNKASAEMRRRIDVKLADNRSAALGIEVTTFHSLAFSALSLAGKAPNLVSPNFLKYSILKSIRSRKVFNYGDAYITGTLVPKIENAVRYVRSFSFKRGELDEGLARRHLEAYISNGATRQFSHEEMMKFLDYMLGIMDDYEERKRELGLIDYNDLLDLYVSLPDGSRKRYDWVLVDELQDLNEVEFEIAIRSGEKHFMVGDPKQSIFGFQGGSLRNFQNFRENLGGNIRILGKNRRSTDEILSYARSFYLEKGSKPGTMEELEQLIPAEEKHGETVSVHLTEDPERYAASLASKIDAASQAVAIVARTNSQIDVIAEYLERSNIPYKSTSPGSPNESSRLDIVKYLQAVISPGKDSIIAALFTPYSEVTLQESFKFAEKYKWAKSLELSALKEVSPSLLAAISDNRSREGIISLFQEKILPIAISLGKSHFIAAHAINLSIQEYYTENAVPDLEGLFDYLSVSSIDFDVESSSSGLILTTVHKAKGMEFDRVIYVPTRTQERLGFVDVVSRSLVLATKGFDPFEELNMEDERVDFVAITRARTGLDILVKPKLQARYAVGSAKVQEDDLSGVADPLIQEFDRIFAMLAHGRKEEALKAARRKSSWLTSLIHSYFKKDAKLSYSTISSISSPIRFLSNYILNIRQTGKALSIGSQVHDYAQDIFEGEEIPAELGSLEPIVENVRKIIDQVKTEFQADQKGAEISIAVHVSDIYPELAERYPNTEFKGKLDAVFESASNDVIILDYKTDQRLNDEYVREHRLQLYLYKMMYARKYSMEPNKIRVCAGYVNLKDRINTGRIDSHLDLTEPSKVKINSFRNLISRYYDYRDNPDVFIQDLLAERDDNSHLQAEIKSVLRDETSSKL